MRAEPLCVLRDCTIEYINDEGFLPPVPGEIHTISELMEHLHAAAARPPHALRMDLPGEFRAWIHIGGPLGAVHVTKVYVSQPMPANPPDAWIALPDRPLPVNECVSFLTEGSHGADDIGGDQLHPVADVIQIGVHLVEHRALPSTHAWVRHYGNGSCTYVAKSQQPAMNADARTEAFSPIGILLYDDESHLKAIAACPGDRQLRRLYADWLEAIQPRRTELIRVCEEMRDVPVWSDRYWQLKARRNELWEQCPLDWLEATGYDGCWYDPIFRDGVPDGCCERWRLIREFTERWHGISVPDIGGREAEIQQAEARLGLSLPLSLREFLAYVHDIADSSPSHDPRCYNTLFHSAYFILHHLQRHSALSLIHFTLDCGVLGIAHEDLGAADPRTYFFDEVIDENGVSIPPSLPRPHREPTVFGPSLSLSIFSNLFIQLPAAGDMEAWTPNPDDWLSRLARDFPIHARFDDAHIFENDELLVLLRRRGDHNAEHLIEVIVRRPIPAASVPAYLFGGAEKNSGSAGMLTPASNLWPSAAEMDQLAVPQPAYPAHIDLAIYKEWIRQAGFYPAWLSILRRREVERRVQNGDEYPTHEEAPRPEPTRFESYDDIPF